MTVDQMLHGQQIYDPGDERILAEQDKYQDLLYQFNMTPPSAREARLRLLHQMLGDCGEGCWIEPPFHANWGGHFVHFGSHVYANFNLTCVDDTHIYVGDYTMIGPGCIFASANHPILPALREKAYQYNLPIHIGRNCWLGAGVIVVPGVTIGDGAVIGAGSVVTKDIPANVVAVGNPCRVLRPIGDRDREFYYRDRRIDWTQLPDDAAL